MPRKRSPLSDREALLDAIQHAESAREVLNYLGLRAAGGNYRLLREYAQLHDLQIPKYDFKKQQAQRLQGPIIPDSEVFVENSAYSNRSALKKRLYKLGFEEKCLECGIGPVWNNKPITLQLDHINGIHNDHRLENLRILCPNCHSQTETYAGRSSADDQLKKKRVKAVILQQPKPIVEKEPKPTVHCLDCNAPVYRTAKRCPVCAPKARYGTEEKYPAPEVLLAELAVSSFVQVAKGVGVSDNALRKHLRKVLGAEHPVLAPRKRKQ